MELRSALLVLLPLIAAARSPDVRLKVSVAQGAPSDVGVIWEGPLDAEEGFEKLAALVKPGESTVQNTFHEQSFTLRSSDMKFRVRMTILDNLKNLAGSHPHRLTFKNLNHDGKPGSAVELKHGRSEYIWIDSGKQVTHGTDRNHHFILRDSNNVDIVDVVLLAKRGSDDL
jgi:hypothetical protein